MQAHNVNRHLAAPAPSFWDAWPEASVARHDHEMPYTSIGQHVYHNLRLVSICATSRKASALAHRLNAGEAAA